MSRKKQAHHITNISELLIIIVYIISGSLILGMNLFHQSSNISMYLLSGWMFGSALFMRVNRIRRIKGNNRFDRSVRGDLDHAISVATYQVLISQIMLWNVQPIGALTLLGLWEGGKPIGIVVIVLLFFALSYYAGGWVHNTYKRKKRELEVLKKKLDN